MALIPTPEHLKALSKSEYEIFEYIIRNEKKVKDMSIHELADMTFSSTATIMRLCKKLDYKGFSELKFNLADSNAPTSEASDFDFDDVIRLSSKEIENTTRTVDESSILHIADLINSKRHIHFFAKGLSRMPFRYFSKYLLTCGRLNTEYEDSHIALLNANEMNKDDVLFVASISGMTPQIIKVVQLAKAKGATVIAFTNMNNNPLSKLADINLYVTSYKFGNTKYDVQSRLSFFYIIDLIIHTYLLRSDIEVYEKDL